MLVLSAADLEHFADRGYVRVSGAFTPHQAEAMRAAVWDQLQHRGIRRDDPSTWTVESPDHLQDLKQHPAFRAVGSGRTIGAIDQLLGTAGWRRPADWGACFILFPTEREWTVSTNTWHADHDYTELLDPPRELKVHTLFGDVEPRAGGMQILAGSHRVVAAFVRTHPPAPTKRAAQIRKAMMRSHPYLAGLERDGDPQERIRMYMERDENVDGVPLRVVELTGEAGDVVLIHPLVLHTRPTNAGRAPRFMLNKDLYGPATTDGSAAP
jgi:hypothetical protein